MLIYGLSRTGYSESIVALAEAHGLKIVSVGAPCSFAHRSCVIANPREWAILFSQAKVVVTGMFHGVQLALLNEALPFYIGSEEKKAKVVDSLSRYGLEQQWVNEPGDLGKAVDSSWESEMEEVGQLRRRIASDSLAWLETQLS